MRPTEYRVRINSICFHTVGRMCADRGNGVKSVLENRKGKRQRPHHHTGYGICDAAMPGLYKKERRFHEIP
jgi:hypothetical protein